MKAGEVDLGAAAPRFGGGEFLEDRTDLFARQFFLARNLDRPGRLFGVGADLYGNERVGVFTEAAYVLPFGDVDDFDQVSIGFGIILRFYGD